MAKEKIKLTNAELKSYPKNLMPFNGAGGVISNKQIIKSLCDELLEYRLRDAEGDSE